VRASRRGESGGRRRKSPARLPTRHTMSTATDGRGLRRRRPGQDEPTATTTDRVVRWAVVVVAGIAVGLVAWSVTVSGWLLVGVSIGLAVGVIWSRSAVLRLAIHLRKVPPADWEEHLPEWAGPLRRLLRAAAAEAVARHEALRDSLGREQLRDVELDVIGEQAEDLRRRLAERQDDFDYLVAAIKTALWNLRRRPAVEVIDELETLLDRLQRVTKAHAARLEPSTPIPLGDVVVEAVGHLGLPRGRVVVGGPLPVVEAPGRLLLELVQGMMRTAVAGGDPRPVMVSGQMDRGVAVLEVLDHGSSPPPPASDLLTDDAPGFDRLMALRAARLLGGDLVFESRDGANLQRAVIPARHRAEAPRLTVRQGDGDV